MKNIKLTEGPIMKNMLLFALPMMAGNFLQQIYNIADMFIVGRFIGSDALAAVGSAYTLMTFLTSLIIGLCMGSGAIFSKWYGAGQEEEMKQDIKLSFLFIGGVTVVVTLLVFPGTDSIFRQSGRCSVQCGCGCCKARRKFYDDYSAGNRCVRR